MSENGKRVMTVEVPMELYVAVSQEAKDSGVSRGAVIRWALMERYRRQAQKAGFKGVGLVGGAEV